MTWSINCKYPIKLHKGLLMKAFFILLTLLSFSSMAHEFRLQGQSPIFNKFNVKKIGVARVSLKSDFDYLNRGKSTRHQHCFTITTSSSKLISSKQNICSTTAGIINISVTSHGVESGFIEFRENSTNTFISIPLVFSTPLKTSVANRFLEVNKCTAISITGGVPPYTIKTSKPDMGFYVEGKEFCAHPKLVGTYSLSISDSVGQSQVHQMWTKGPITEFSMRPQDWNILYGHGMPLNPTKNDSLSWYLDFPQIGRGVLGYVTQNVYPGRLIIGSALQAKITIETTSNAVFDHYTNPNNTSDFPAHVRFFIQRGASLSYDPMDRWWSNPVALKLQDGKWELKVKLSPDQWTNVNGQRGDSSISTISGFNRALQEVNQVGFTFGGGFFFGHGVRVKDGEARFILEEMTIVHPN